MHKRTVRVCVKSRSSDFPEEDAVEDEVKEAELHFEQVRFGSSNRAHGTNELSL